jgi:hypothetical protein
MLNMMNQLHAKFLKVVLMALSMSCCHFSWAQSISKGFQALEMHDYFRSKKIFEKKLKKEASPAAYGLAKIYYTNNNPFYNIDSAHRYIVQSIETFDLLKNKKKVKYQRFGFSLDSLMTLRQDVSNELFARARKEDSESGYARFIADNFWATQVPYAVLLRDSCAFEYAVANGTSDAMTVFMEKYPTSTFEARAQDLFYRFQFEEQTRLGQEIHFADFIKDFPENPYVSQADQRIFRFYEDKSTIKSYEKFIQSYPNSAYVSEAWIRLYRVFIRENGLAYLGIFKSTYPNYPFMQELEQEIALLNAQLFPFMRGNKWGFMNHEGKILIQAKFDFVEAFSQGRAIAIMNDLYGFIDPMGAWVIQAQFSDVLPFRFNLSVVYDADSKAGLMNLFGEWILKPDFDDIILINDEKVWVENESKYVIYNIKTNQFSQTQYTEVSDFVDGLALVSDTNGYALIDMKGVAKFTYNNEIQRFGDLFLVSINDSLALVDDNNKVVLPFDTYDFGAFNPQGLTAFVLHEKLGYINADGAIAIEPRLDMFPNWEIFASFYNGYAKAYNQKAKKFGLIDEKGLWILQAKYNDVSFYSNNIAVQITDKWEYINATGQRLNMGVFDRAESFLDGVALVFRDEKVGLINPKGEIIVPIEMQRVNRITEEILRWEDATGKLWLGANDGTLIWPESCEKIDKIDDYQIRFISNQEVYYYLIKEKRIVSALP